MSRIIRQNEITVDTNNNRCYIIVDILITERKKDDYRKRIWAGPA